MTDTKSSILAVVIIAALCAGVLWIKSIVGDFTPRLDPVPIARKTYVVTVCKGRTCEVLGFIRKGHGWERQ